MISLRKTIEAFDYRLMFEAAVESYRAAIDNLESNTIDVDREGVNEYRVSLQALRRRLSPAEIRPETLRMHAEDLGAELKRYRGEIESLLKGTGNDLRDVVAVLAEATETLSQRETLHGGQLSRISGGLETIAQIDDVHQIRKRLSQHVVELRTCIDQMAQENESALQGLHQELKSFQKRLEKVQVEASTDPLTGVANRRRAGREIATRMRERRSFGILLFDLNRFKQINDAHGHAAGDSVLQVVAQRLQGQVRKEDLVCRWGGDEFVVVHEGRAQELRERAREIAGKIAGKISVKLHAVDHEVAIGTEVGWAEYVPGENAEQLFARADRALYENKQMRPGLVKQAAPCPATASLVVAHPATANAVTAGTTRTPLSHQEGMVAAASFDPSTGLPAGMAAENAMNELGREASTYFVGCFAFRRAPLVNAHYHYPATEELLPFLRDKLLSTKFTGRLFRGPGASILALVDSPAGAEALEEELGGIAAGGWEKHLQQKRRASKLPVGVRGKVIALNAGVPAALQEIDTFLTLNHAVEKVAY